MIQSLKQIRDRIRGVTNTKKVTHAMEMISVSKFRSAETQLLRSRPYSESVESLLRRVIASDGFISHPYFTASTHSGSVVLAVVASETGLCGAYNHAILRLAENFLAERQTAHTQVVPIGKKAATYFRRRGIVCHLQFVELHGRFSVRVSEQITEALAEKFYTQQADEVYVAYTKFVSASRHLAVVERILPISITGEAVEANEYIWEPDRQDIARRLIHAFFASKMQSILLNSFACEHAARMLAMREATTNAEDLLDSLTLTRNKMRQANITKEIMEIISSAEALR